MFYREKYFHDADLGFTSSFEDLLYNDMNGHARFGIFFYCPFEREMEVKRTIWLKILY